jgi:hypothetical protein
MRQGGIGGWVFRRRVEEERRISRRRRTTRIIKTKPAGDEQNRGKERKKTRRLGLWGSAGRWGDAYDVRYTLDWKGIVGNIRGY